MTVMIEKGIPAARGSHPILAGDKPHYLSKHMIQFTHVYPYRISIPQNTVIEDQHVHWAK